MAARPRSGLQQERRVSSRENGGTSSRLPLTHGTNFRRLGHGNRGGEGASRACRAACDGAAREHERTRRVCGRKSRCAARSGLSFAIAGQSSFSVPRLAVSGKKSRMVQEETCYTDMRETTISLQREKPPPNAELKLSTSDHACPCLYPCPCLP